MRNPKPAASVPEKKPTARKSTKTSKPLQTARKSVSNVSQRASSSHSDTDSDSVDFLSRPNPYSNPALTRSQSSRRSDDSIDFLSRPNPNPSESQTSSSNSRNSQDNLSVQSPSVSRSDRGTPRNVTQNNQQRTATKRQRKQPAPKKSNRKTRVLREVMRLQNTTNLLIAKAPFQR